MLGLPLSSRCVTALVITACLPLAAAPVADRIHGISNFHVVNDQVYRGGQPSGEGFRNLAAAGFKTIVDLREDDERGKDEKKLVKALGMHYVNVPMKGMKTPSDKQISKALKALIEEKSAPVFIHCKRGADRTGVVLACYRMEHDNWDRQQALSEARELGMSWYQLPLIRYVQSYRPHGNGNAVDNASDAVRDFAGDAVDTVKRATRGVTEIFK
jgi:protein tyrosine/serine phosphatase